MFSHLCQVRVFLFAAFLVAFIRAPASADVIDKVAGDFKSLSGYVIMETEGEYLVDLDADKGISVGDLFSVVAPGKKIIHPVSGKELGTLEEVKGVLKVTRLQTGYSYARPLGAIKGIKRGDPIRRYENIPAIFWDYSGRGEPFFTRLRNILPNLKWQDYAAAQADRPEDPAAHKVGSPALLFIFKKEGLEVRDSEFQVTHTYVLPESFPSSVAPAPMVPYALEKSNKKIEEGTGYKAAFPGFQAEGDLPGATLMADFIRDGDRLLVATADWRTVRVHRVDRDVSFLAENTPKGIDQILAVQWWRPAQKGALYLAMTVLYEQKIKAKIFDLRENKLVPLKVRLPYILGAFDLDADGNPETLLRQSFDPDLFWGRRVRKLNLTDGKLETLKPDIKLPGNFTVLGSLFADLTGDGQLESVFVRGKELYIYSGKKQLYRSSPGFGGSLSVATYEVDPGAKDIFIRSTMVEVSPVAADLDGDGRPELIVVASDGFILGAPGIAPNIKNTRLAVVKYRDGMFVKGTLGEVLGDPVPGLSVVHGRLLFISTNTGSFFGKGARSHLLAYPLAR
jgi:hypothetical protein